MAPSPRQIARMVPTRGMRPRTLGLWECPRCVSRYVQPVEWEVLPSGRVSLELRCPDCLAWRKGTFTMEQVRELERVLVRGRAELKVVYRRTVRDNMYKELDALIQGLTRDLIGPDDFAPRQSSRCSAYQP